MIEMNTLHKKCQHCALDFNKPRNTSVIAWHTRTKYCSRQCSDASKIGISHSSESNKKRSISVKKAYDEGRKVSNFKNTPPWNKGLTQETDDRVAKVTDKQRNRVISNETRGRISKSLRGRFSGKNGTNWKGGKVMLICKCCSNEYYVSQYRVGKSKYCSRACHAKDHPHTTDLKLRIRNSKRYAEWRSAVYERDKHTCQECGTIGGRLNADHIKSFSLVWIERKVQCFKDALMCEELWDVSNGQTLCESCHRKTDNFGGRSTRDNLKVVAA